MYIYRVMLLVLGHILEAGYKVGTELNTIVDIKLSDMCYYKGELILFMKIIFRLV